MLAVINMKDSCCQDGSLNILGIERIEEVQDTVNLRSSISCPILALSLRLVRIKQATANVRRNYQSFAGGAGSAEPTIVSVVDQKSTKPHGSSAAVYTPQQPQSLSGSRAKILGSKAQLRT